MPHMDAIPAPRTAIEYREVLHCIADDVEKVVQVTLLRSLAEDFESNKDFE